MDYLRLTSLVVVCIASIVLALSVYLRNRKNPSHRAFAAAVFSVVLWLLLSYAAEQPEFALVALSLSRLALATAIAASGFLLNFALTFPTAEMQQRIGWRLFLASYFAFAFLTAFTPFVISGVVRPGRGTSVLPGRFYTLVAAWVVAGVLMPLAVLVLKFRSTTRPRSRPDRLRTAGRDALLRGFTRRQCAGTADTRCERARLGSRYSPCSYSCRSPRTRW